MSSSLHHVRAVRVGSTNPPKLAGVREAIRAYSERAEVRGVEVESGVSEQPLGFEEILEGARRRAAAAHESGPCDLAVGYEDGLVQVGPEGDWFNIGCAAVSDGRRVTLGLSSGFGYPPACIAAAVERREPIGDVFDRTWRAHRPEAAPRAPSALSVGNVGKLTEGAVDRAEYTRHAVVCALAPWLHPDLYAAEGTA